MRLGVVEIKDVLRYEGEPVRVDFHAIGPGLIAVVGANGEGKTTLVEAPHASWDRRFPTRPDRQLYDYAHGRHAYVRTSFEAIGRGWFANTLTLDSVARGSKGIVRHSSPDGADGPLITDADGLLGPYDAWMRAHVPARTVRMASAFGAQDRRGGFAALEIGERRDLFSRLLGHGEMAQQAAIASAAAKTIEQGRPTLKTRRDLIARDLTTMVPADLERRAAAIARDQAAQVARRDALASVIADLLHRQAAARVAMKVHEEAVVRRREAVIALQAMDLECATLDQELDRIEQARQREIAAACQAETSARTDAETRLRNNRAVLADADAIRSAVDLVQAAETALGELRVADTQGRAALAHAEQVRLEVERRIAAAVQADADIRIAMEGLAAWAARDAAEMHLAIARAEETAAVAVHAAALDAVEESAARVRDVEQACVALDLATADAALIDRVPFGERCVAAGCAFVQQAQQSRAALLGLQTRVATKADTGARHAECLRALDEARAALDAQMRALASAAVLPAVPPISRDELQAHLRDLGLVVAVRPALEQRLLDVTDDVATQRAKNAERDEAMRRTEEKLAAARPLAHRAAALEAAEARIAELERQILAAEEARAREVAAAQDRADAAVARLHARRAAMSAEQPQVEARVRAADADMAAHADAADELEEIEQHLRDHQHHRETAAVQVATLQTQAAAIATQVEIAMARQAELAQVEDSLKTLDVELLEWQLLAKALGRDGLPTLEIDAAGPSVSAICNDLLVACFGGRFSVDLVTQEATADGKGVKESFELKVYDGERGGRPRDLSDLSGGEQIIVDECLKAALCVFNNQRSPVPMLTCWRDETTGPLDAENAPRYIAMLRRLQQLAGFEQVIFVTHSAEAAAQADAQIHCADGRVTVHMAPFVEAA